ncbi:endonuclease/exonuclease/phosphatase family protein [Sphingomonas arenae]|uniref:endonuclease/exonuclease/phosphatase family protein n=1 Tax=Sphingomonas arenae TaxID=2812555 RepID=UPI00196850B5|nr:endonuclease/exonuclease/phosphatase family protein [Sphingomonas arenae]
MKALRAIALTIVLLLVLLTVLPIFEGDEWWVRLWDYPRVQIAAGLLLGVVVLLFTGRDRVTVAVVAAGVAAIGWQLLQIAPYLPGWPKQVASATRCGEGRSIRLLNANVLLDNERYPELRRLVERTDPDLILLLEPGPEWESAMHPLYARYPFRIGQPIPNTYGIMLLSKLPLENAEILHRVQPQVPSIRAGLRLRSGELVDFHGVHPEPPLPGDDSGERDAELVLVGRDVRASGRAAIVLGDLNDVAWSNTSRLFRKVGGMLDPRVGRGPTPTFPVAMPWLRWPLDHVFVTSHWSLMGMRRLPDIGSDHFPMLFDLCLTRAAERRLTPTTIPEEVREDAVDQLKDGAEEMREENAL